MVSIATTEPRHFVAGDTVEWTRFEPDYRPEDGWTLTYTLTSRDGTFAITASDNGDGKHLINLAAATSVTYPPGEYRWQANVTKAAERHTVDWGTVEVLADLASSGASDTRTTAARLLEAVEATLEGRATTDQASYSVGGVSISRLSLAELLSARSKLVAEVAREKAAERIANGLGHPGNVRVRL